jgi:hypothetical protein
MGGGGRGGTGGVDPCAFIPIMEYSDLEAGDVAQVGVGIGEVEGACPGSPCEGDDPIDRWAITACGERHQVELTWDDSGYNLDLFLYTSDESDNWSSQGNDTMQETITADLENGEQYIIQVQAIDTLGVPKAYNVTARRSE